MSDDRWRIQDYASLGLVVFGGVVFYCNYKQPTPPSSPPHDADVPVVSALDKVLQRDNVEFFFTNDGEQQRGLVSHEPLTIVALSKLWNKHETIPEDVLDSFHEGYKVFLEEFHATLVPPRSSFSSPIPPSPLTGLSDEEFCVWVRSKRGVGTEAMDQLTPAITSRLLANGVGHTVSRLLREVGDEKGILASLFHGFILVCYSLDLIEHEPSPSSPPSAPSVLVGTGLAAMTARAGLKGEGLWDHLQGAPNQEDMRSLQERLDHLLEDEEGKKLWGVVSPLLQTPVFPFGIMGAIGLIEENEEALKIWKELSGKHLSGAKIEAPFEELAEVSLRYFIQTKGCFLALHIVSSAFALCRLHAAAREGHWGKIDEDVLFSLGHALWNVVGMVVWVAEKGAESEGVSVWDRARGRNKPTLDELATPSPDDPTLAWDILSQRATMTLQSHTIKMVFACLCLTELFPDGKEIGRLAPIAANIACLHASG